MTTISQQPPALNLNAVAGDPFALIVNLTFTDSNDSPIPWGDISNWSVAVASQYGQALGLGDPTVTSPQSGQLLISWSALQTEAVGVNAAWALSLEINGVEATLVAGKLNFYPETVAGADSPTTATLAVSVGTTTASIAVTTAGSSGGGGSGTVDSVVAGTSVHVDATDPANPVVSIPANTFDAHGAATTAQAAAIAASDPVGSAATAQAAAIAAAATDATTKANAAAAAAEAASDPSGTAALKLAKASNLSDLASASTARTNLGLGTAATQATGAFDASGAAAAAQAAAIAASDPAGSATTAQAAAVSAAAAAAAVLYAPVLNSFQKYVAGASPANTRRSTLALSGDGNAGLQTVADFAQRSGFTLPVTPTRYRFKIANQNCLANTRKSGVVNGTGLWIGVPNVGAENAWAGDFTTAPKQVVSSFTVDPSANGTEYVSAWITNAGELVANQFAGVSSGFTTAVQVNQGSSPTIRWATSGSAASAGTAAVPTGTRSVYAGLLDIRIEYEFVGSNQIGLFIGDSVQNGQKSAATIALNAPIGHMGPDDAYPSMSGLRNGYCNINGAISGAQTSTWTSSSALAWTRFDLATCCPDYAVIALGCNDAGVNQTSLATYQSNIRSIIADLTALGISKVILVTSTTLFNFGFASSNVGMGGLLNAQKTAGAIGTIVLTGTNASGPAGAGGMPGVAADWFNASLGPWTVYFDLPTSQKFEGPFTVTAATLSGNLTLTVSGSIVNTHPVNTPILTGPEALRQQYNNWIRQLPPGANAFVDAARIAEWDYVYPAVIGNPRVYDNTGDIHPTNAGLYGQVAAEIVNSLQGV